MSSRDTSKKLDTAALQQLRQTRLVNPPPAPPPVATSFAGRPTALAAEQQSTAGSTSEPSAESGYKSDHRTDFKCQLSEPHGLYSELRKPVKVRHYSDSACYKASRADKVRSAGNMPAVEEIRVQVGNQKPLRTAPPQECCQKFKDRKRHSSSCSNADKAARSSTRSMEKERDPNITSLNKLHTRSFAHINAGLNYDETQDEDNAIEEYKKGLAILEEALKIKVRESHCKGPDWEKARILYAKMEGNKANIQSRLDKLEAERMVKDLDRNPKPVSKSAGGGSGRTAPKKQPLLNRKSSRDNMGKEARGKFGVKRAGTPANAKCTFGGVPTPTPSTAYPRRVSHARSPKTPAGANGHITTSKALKNIDNKLKNIILDEVVENAPGVSWEDIAGLDNAKKALQEIVILPTLRPDLFSGLRAPARGLLLFGPPGNGKTMLAKAVATEANCTFFNISAASLTSKYIGEGEKLVKSLFAIAMEISPAIIFIDEIDSLLTERKENEHEATRRLKTEFLVQFDGVVSDPDKRLLVMGATNRPQDLDDAALRRLVKRVYVPLPDSKTRALILQSLLNRHDAPLSHDEIVALARKTEGYSASDMTALAQDAAFGPIRSLAPDKVKDIPADKLRKINYDDFVSSLQTIRPSVSKNSLAAYEEWNSKFGAK